MDKDTGATFPFDPEMINRWVEDLPAVADPVSAYKQVMDMWGGVLAPLAKAGQLRAEFLVASSETGCRVSLIFPV